MKHFTLLFLSAMFISAPAASIAQTKVPQAAVIKKTAKAVAKVFNPKRDSKVLKSEIAGKKYLPKTVKQYIYDNNTLEYLTTKTYTYDQYGNVQTFKREDASGMIQIVKNTYDTDETSFMTSQTQELYDNPGTTYPDHIYMNKRIDVTRNQKGQVTEFTSYEPNDSYNGLEMESVTTIEYGNDDKANKISITEYDEDGAIIITFTDIVWETYNGKLLSTLEDEMDNIVLSADNLIKSASMSMKSNGVELKGNVTSTYTDTERTLNISMIYSGMTIGNITYYYKSLDNNGSYLKKLSSSLMGEDSDVELYKYVYNEKKDLIEETNSEGSSDNDLQIDSSDQYEYSYNESTGLADYAIVKEYNSDSKKYEQKYKLEYCEYNEIATGINKVLTNTKDGNTAVYNTQGMQVGSSTDNLPNGIYIIKQDGKTFKITK